MSRSYRGSRNPFFFYEDDNPPTNHHVPPRNPDSRPHFLLKKDERHHRAYHLLFQAAKSYEDCPADLSSYLMRGISFELSVDLTVFFLVVVDFGIINTSK